MAVLRTYIGETSEAVIASMPPEKREKSTLKYTTFLLTFSVCTVSVIAGPGVFQHTYMSQIYIPHYMSCSALWTYMYLYTSVCSIEIYYLGFPVLIPYFNSPCMHNVCEDFFVLILVRCCCHCCPNTKH